jgi:5-methyltetrahydropteroyltriglutamate--homocysteine methyltransferase
MKKWIDSNYHYMVPEFDQSSKVDASLSAYLADVKRGVEKLGAACATPVVLGPVSIVRLMNFQIKDAGKEEALLDQLIPVYAQLIKDLQAIGVAEVQFHEPVLVFDEASLLPLFKKTYPAIICPGVAANMVSFFEDVGADNYEWLISVTDISVISLDFTRGENLALVNKFGFPAEKTLGCGIVDGRNVWKVDPSVAEPILSALSSKVQSIRIQPSASLQFIPWDLSCETDILAHPAGQVLSFTIQKISEVALVAKVAKGQATLDDHKAAWAAYRKELAGDKSVVDRVAALTEKDFSREESFEVRDEVPFQFLFELSQNSTIPSPMSSVRFFRKQVRRPKQLKGVPTLPTTTIGSFPQTPEVRRLRTQLKKGTITQEQYDAAIDKQIAFAIGIQESLGLDIFVHGEAERTDMVEFFAQNMDGMLFSTNGWVQSFGSRCVRPPIFWNDIKRGCAMTVREFAVAQSLTSKPVKGMLTGPVTILNWSFPRVDVSRETQAMQIGLAIRDEITDLEEAVSNPC